MVVCMLITMLILKCTILCMKYVHSHCCATIITIHFQNFFIPDRNSVPLSNYSPTLLSLLLVAPILHVSPWIYLLLGTSHIWSCIVLLYPIYFIQHNIHKVHPYYNMYQVHSFSKGQWYSIVQYPHLCLSINLLMAIKLFPYFGCCE